MVFNWSIVGGDSMTSRLYSRGGASVLVGGYGAEIAERSMFRALFEGGEDAWWLLDNVSKEIVK
jgi:hypothetical protein